MTREELDLFVSTEEGAAWLTPIVNGELPKYIAPTLLPALIDDAKKPLLSQQAVLLNEAKTAKDQKKVLQDQADNNTRYLHLLEDFNIGLDDDNKLDYSKVEDVLRNIRAGKDNPASGANATELAEVQRQLKKSLRDHGNTENALKLKDTEIAGIQENIEVRDTFIHDLLITSAMRAALGKANYPEIVIANILPQLVAKSGAQVNYDESRDIKDRWSAITDDNRSIDDWVKYWATTEDGQFFMPGRKNSGGGATGSGNGNANKPWKEMDLTERNALFQTDPALYRQMKTPTAG